MMKIPSEETRGLTWYKSATYQGTIYVNVKSEEKKATCKLNEGRWEVGDLLELNWGWAYSCSHCVIENVSYRQRRCSGTWTGPAYRYDRRKIDWYDSEKELWTTLKGLERVHWTLFSTRGRVILTDYGGKRAVLWEENVPTIKETKIWCAEIAVDKRQKGEIWGMLEWCDVVYTANDRDSLVHALTTTI
ncbi:unnamed protein product [Microthlaspi erraticum]|uniref:FKB95-like N-terminal Kelch domain-containing protein n=1 Tax=Microthlaspi erraticum TaxID=1685480 RepID=A0A6D2INM7_9BRAS|nr:unnamed protein product [Microthlaspi erraticum]